MNSLNVPQLRFPEFEGEWEIEKLKDISKIERGRFSPRPRNNPIYYNGEIPFVQTSDVVNANGKIEFYTQTLNEKGLAVSKLFPKGSILITIAANIGHSGVLQIDMACPDSLIGIKPNKNIDNYYLNYYLSTHQKKMDYLAPEGAQKNINIEFLNPYKVPTTTLKEQQKIASFLSAVDEKIQQLSRKKELLEQYKKGVMQQLFSGKLRFKDENGEEYPEWDYKVLDDVIHFVNGKGHEQSIDENGDFVVVNSKFVSTQGRVRKFCNTQISPLTKGDMVLVMSDVPNGKALAKCYLIEKNNVYTLNQRICGLKAKKDNLNEFLIYLLNRNKYYLSFDSGVGQTNLKKDEVLNCPLFIPTSIKEQQKIANFLSGIDGKIEQVNGELVKAQEFKKGLLQQLFV